MEPRALIFRLSGFSLLLLLLATMLWLLWQTGTFYPIDKRLSDLAQKHLNAPPVETSPLVYVKIGDIADQPWPWQSLDYAILVHSILRYFPKTVAMETLFYNATGTEQSVYDVQLQRQLKRLNQIVVAVPVLSKGNHLGVARSLRPFASIPREPSTLPHGFGLWPIDPVAETGTVAPTVFTPDADGKVRRVALLTNYQGTWTATFPLVVYARHLGADLASSGAVLGEKILLKDSQGQLLDSIPINQQGEILLRFHKELPLKKEVEFYSVILAAENKSPDKIPALDLGVFRKSLVLLGREHPGTIEQVDTPIGKMSPARLQLQTLHSLISGDTPKSPGRVVMGILIGGMILAGATLSITPGQAASYLSGAALILTSGGLVAVAFAVWSIWTPPSAVLLAAPLGWLAGRSLIPLIFFEKSAVENLSSIVPLS